MFRDNLNIKDEFNLGLNCGLCGKPATNNHICEEKEEKCKENEVENQE